MRTYLSDTVLETTTPTALYFDSIRFLFFFFFRYINYRYFVIIISSLVYGLEVLLTVLGIWLYGFWIGLPIRGANLAVFLDELERFYQTKSLVDAPADRQVVDAQLTEDSLLVDYEEPSQSHTRVLQKDIVARWYLFVEVTEERITEIAAEAALLSRRVHPRQVTEVRVSRHSDHLRVQRLEVLYFVAERQQLRWTDERTGRESKIFFIPSVHDSSLKRLTN